MQDENLIDHPRVRELLRRRANLRVVCTVLAVLVYGAFIYAVSVTPEWFSRPMSEESIVPIGIVLFVASIVAVLLVELIYVLLSSPLDKLQAQIKGELDA